MPHWRMLCLEACPIRRLILPPSTLSLLRGSSSLFPLPSPSRFRVPPRFRLRSSFAAFSSTFNFTSTPTYCSSLSRSHPSSRLFASSTSQIYSFTPSSAMQSVRISSPGDIADALMEALLSFGAASCSIEDSNLGAPQEQEIYSEGPIPWQSGKRQLWKDSTITALFAAGEDVSEALAMAANSVGLKEMPRYVVEVLEDCDWVLEVESQFKPVEVSEGLWIVPKWSQPPDAKALNVIIDPGLAFGTGEHPTTRLCLRWLHSVVRPGDKIIDYGTGSGILSIAALKMGSVHAVGVDIDPVAISSAEYNASLNNLKPNTLQVYVAPADGDDPVPKEFTDFDVVVANILLNPLVELAGRITGYCKTGGLVGVSGILVEQVPKVKEAYSLYLDDISVSYDNGWACVSGRKKGIVETSARPSQSLESQT
ncbi:uncharacterized protein [Physcomitrium patens]|uniref:ETFB lysine methyltransferase n=1 Tax=Physcomitrium patens TaxID=3218 RepID=A0A2K1INM8_PHYPA|nr:uncharacterized protein LOC112275393 [Physcomitrium patens]PNR30883.1 hypothetical protein PHYPA_027199 [Physcomitrium patens]|eukprot:XP_024361523.1 uncharacterized protein LOC112275393 [Physcomitrella patens]